VDGQLGQTYNTSLATVTKTYPTGKGGEYVPWELGIRLDNNEPTVIVGEMNTSFKGYQTPPFTPLTVNAPMDTLVGHRYWRLTKEGWPDAVGKTAAGPANINEGDITLRWTSADTVTPTIAGLMTIAHDPWPSANGVGNSIWSSIGAAGLSGSPAGGSATSSTPFSSSTDTIGYFMWGRMPLPLPVEDLDFQVAHQNGISQFDWTTSSEQNNAGFILSMSTRPNGGYEPIAHHLEDPELQSKGDATTTTSYAFQLPQELTGGQTYFFRLQSQNINGQVEQTEIRSLRLPLQSEVGALHPNPTFGNLNLPLSLTEQTPVSVTAYNLQGQKVGTLFEDALDSGSHSLNLQLGDLSRGTYVLHIRTAFDEHSRKVILR